MGLNAGQVLLAQFYPDVAETVAHSGMLGHGHSHSHGPIGPSIHAAWLAAGSIVVKEWLYRASKYRDLVGGRDVFIYQLTLTHISIAMKVAEERKSSVLASNAVHHRIDSLTSIVALFTIGGSYIFQDATWLDPVGGLLISLMVIKAGWGNTCTSLLELADTAVDEDVRTSVEDATMKALSEIEGGSDIKVRDVQGMKSGQNYLMDIELAVPGAWSISRSQSIEQSVRHIVGTGVRGVKRIKVRFIPAEQQELTFSDEFVAQDSSVDPEPQGHSKHQ